MATKQTEISLIVGMFFFIGLLILIPIIFLEHNEEKHSSVENIIIGDIFADTEESTTEEYITKGIDYYKSKGYQVFPQYKFAIKAPCKLKDVSMMTSNDFTLNYMGTENENDKKKFAAYQLILTRLPASFIHLSQYEQGAVKRKLLEQAQLMDSYEEVKVGYEGYDGLIMQTRHNGYILKSVTFIKDDYIFGLVVISNDNINGRLNQFTNSLRFFEENTDNNTQQIVTTQQPIQHSNGYKNYTKSGNQGFSISYPEDWEIQREHMQSPIELMVMKSINGNKFRTNYSVIVRNNPKSLEESSDRAIQQIKQTYNFDNFKVLSRQYQIINGVSYLITQVTYNYSGYVFRQICYECKKSNNTKYTITFTLDNTKYLQELSTIKNIIQSFKIF